MPGGTAVKDQYFGDVNDYRKYGLLRALGHAGFKTLVVWMLTPNDTRSDGLFTDYLDKPSHWKRYDKELYDALHDWVRVSRARRVASIEHSTLLPAATFFSSRVPDDRAGRERYADGIMQAAGGADVVFLDPDNGIEVPSTKYGRKNSSKYVYWLEIQALATAGRSVLVYQHYPRKPHEPFAQQRGAEFAEKGRFSRVVTIDAQSVVYLCGCQAVHRSRMDAWIDTVRVRWSGQISICDVWTES